MKTLFVFLFSLSVLSASAQFRDAKKKTSIDTVTVSLSAWQQEQIAFIESQKKALDEKMNFLLLSIFDFNHVRQSAVTSLELKPGQLVIIRKKD
jgi:hypothetical protein